MPSLSSDVLTLQGAIVGLRRDLHQHPELSYKESRTAQRVTASCFAHRKAASIVIAAPQTRRTLKQKLIMKAPHAMAGGVARNLLVQSNW